MATILIADDSATARVQLERILSPLGHKLLFASDGAEAQALIDGVDLFILDVVMPKVNGFELCRALKSNPETAPKPVFLVTSMDREPDRYWGLKQGADEYIVKPVDPEQLRVKVRGRLAS